MALIEILRYPDAFLKTKAAPVEKVDDSVRALISDMTETMYHARGIGLAAVQVGVGKRVAVLDVPAEDSRDEEGRRKFERGKNLIALINPEIISSEGETKYEEGCLSVPGFTADVHRASSVKVSALDKDGNRFELDASGLLAIAIQHEIDHLDGILFIDRLSRLKRELMKKKILKAIEAERAL